MSTQPMTRPWWGRSKSNRPDSGWEFWAAIHLRVWICDVLAPKLMPHPFLWDIVAAFNNGFTTAGWWQAATWPIYAAFSYTWRTERIPLVCATSSRKGKPYLANDFKGEWQTRLPRRFWAYDYRGWR